MGPESLPLEYGGTAAEVPVEVAVQQLPAWRQRQQQLGQGEGGAAASKAAAAGAGTAQQVAAAGTAEHGEVRMRHVESASQLAGAV